MRRSNCFPFPKRPGAVEGAAKRTLDDEDRFEILTKGETARHVLVPMRADLPCNGSRFIVAIKADFLDLD